MTIHAKARRGAVLLLLGLAAACSSNGAPSKNVAIRLIAYNPPTLDVGKGTRVTWTQNDAGFHTVTSGTAHLAPSGSVTTHLSGVFRSGRLGTGDRFSFEFTTPGAFPYFCEIHPATMHGSIKVT